MLTLIYWFSWQLVGIVQPPITNCRLQIFYYPPTTALCMAFDAIIIVPASRSRKKTRSWFQINRRHALSLLAVCLVGVLSSSFLTFITLAPSFFVKMSLFCWQFMIKSQKIRCLELFYWLILKLLWIDNDLCPQKVKVLSWRYFTESLISV